MLPDFDWESITEKNGMIVFQISSAEIQNDDYEIIPDGKGGWKVSGT